MRHVVLLGDSIFDNASYVPGEPPVIEQLRAALPKGWNATLLAVDGDRTPDVIHQVKRLPGDASHLVVSCGGNDALGYSTVLMEPASSVHEAMQQIATIKRAFTRSYQAMLEPLITLGKPLTVCTIYDAIPGLGDAERAALSVFNEVILKEAVRVHADVIDLRLICTAASDYSTLSPIEPSAAGGETIARVIARLVTENEPRSRQTRVVS